MAESARLTHILLDIIDRVKHRGSSTKVLWTNFSNAAPLSRTQFDQLIERYGLPLRPGDLDIIWANIGVSGSSMTYSDFVKFINLDKIDANIGSGYAPAYSQPTPQREVPAAMRDTFSEPPTSSRRGPRQDYYDEPPMAKPVSRGYEKQSYDVTKQCNDYQAPSSTRRNESLSEVLIHNKQQIGNALLDMDPTLTGFISAYDFESIVQRISLVNSAEVTRLVSSYDIDGTGYFNYFTLLSDICNQIGPDPSMSRAPAPAKRYDSFMDEQPAYNHPAVDDYPPQRQAYVPEPVPRRSNADEIVQLIAARMGNKYDSSSVCFNRWRGHERSIQPREFVSNAMKDFQIEMTLEDAEEIISRFGGNMTLGNFTKMIGAGSDAVSAQRKKSMSTELDENQKVIMHIARQARGKDWFGVFRDVDSPEKLVQGLRTLNVYVLLNDIRPCWNKYGKEGMVDMVQQFIETL